MAPNAKPRRRLFQPLITGSTWDTVFDAVWDRALKQDGASKNHRTADGTIAPRLTNGEVITLVMAWLAATSKARFPLWYQYAAAAYGWSPDNDVLDTTARQRDAWYPDELLVELWSTLMGLTSTLDEERVSSPRLDMDGTFDDPVFQGEVRAALLQDGADAIIAAKVPLPACKGKDGKPTKPRAVCPVGSELRTGPGGVPVCVDTATGKRTAPKWECDPVTIDDPITGIGKMLGQPFIQGLLILGAIWVALEPQPRRYRRRDR